MLHNFGSFGNINYIWVKYITKMKRIRRLRIIENVYKYNSVNKNKPQLNRQSLALKMRVNSKYISVLNTGYNIPNVLQDLYKISQLLHCEIDDFFIIKNNELQSVNIKNILKKTDSEYKTLEQLCKKVDISSATVYNWSIGISISKSIKPFYNLCRILGIKTIDLIEV